MFGGFTTIAGYRAKEEWDKLRKSKIIDLQALSGELIPNNKSMPQAVWADRIPDNVITIFLGNSAAYTSKFPHTVIQVGGQNLLVLNKVNKNITVSAKFFSKNGKIVAELKENKFYVNPNNYFRIERPDEHSLIVYDQEAQEVLNVEFINPSVIKLLCTFYVPKYPPIIIKEKVQKFGGMQMSGNLFGENNVDIGLK